MKSILSMSIWSQLLVTTFVIFHLPSTLVVTHSRRARPSARAVRRRGVGVGLARAGSTLRWVTAYARFRGPKGGQHLARFQTPTRVGSRYDSR